MQPLDLSIDAFVSWLCFHEYDEVGRPGIWFQSPLARWLSEVSGHTFGVDGKWYGCASCDDRRWQLLPLWAVVFHEWVESCLHQPITGAEALLILARVELALVPMGTSQPSSLMGS